MNHLAESDPTFEYELVRYSEPEEITTCLSEGSCLVSLDYGANQNLLEPQQRRLTSEQVESIPLKILDDPVLNITLPQYGQVITQTVIVALFWLVACFTLFVLFALYITRLEKFQKPVRTDARTTELNV